MEQKRVWLLLAASPKLDLQRVPTLDDLDGHARLSASDGEVHEAALGLRSPVTRLVHHDLPEGI